MKTNLIIAALFTLLSFGCSENLINTDSVDVQNETSFKWMNLPATPALSVETEITESAKINGNRGGELELKGSYTSSENRVVTITSKLTVPEAAYLGAQVITQITSTADAVSDFYPSMTFKSPLILDIKYTGLNLTGVDPATIGFYYIAADGNLEMAQNSGVTVDVENGTIEVLQAKLPHFSRYGFIKGPENTY